VLARHTCAHRVQELLAILAELGIGEAVPARRPLGGVGQRAEVPALPAPERMP
jgi:hypothetical protein